MSFHVAAVAKAENKSVCSQIIRAEGREVERGQRSTKRLSSSHGANWVGAPLRHWQTTARCVWGEACILKGHCLIAFNYVSTVFIVVRRLTLTCVQVPWPSYMTHMSHDVSVDYVDRLH